MGIVGGANLEMPAIHPTKSFAGKAANGKVRPIVLKKSDADDRTKE
jgi:hypothetical protein